MSAPYSNMISMNNIGKVYTCLQYLTAADIEVKSVDIVRQIPLIEIVDNNNNHLRDSDLAQYCGSDAGVKRVQVMISGVRVEWLESEL